MGWSLSELNDKQRAMIPKAEREKLGKAARTSEDALAARRARDERELHKQIEQYCNMREWLHFSSRMDRKTNRPKGEPDFYLLLPLGKVKFVECKTESGELTPEQETTRRRMESLGHKLYVVRSLHEFIQITSESES